MFTSKLTKNQKKVFTKYIDVYGKSGRIELEVRYDDECGNSYNSFSITGAIFSSKTSSADRYLEKCGCIHDEISKYFPEFKQLIKWHLFGSPCPLSYIDNTTYHASSNHVYDFTIKSCDSLISDIYLFDKPIDFLSNLNTYKTEYSSFFPDFTLDSDFQKYRKQNKIDQRKLYYKYSNYSDILKLFHLLDLTGKYSILDFSIKQKKGSMYKDPDISAARNSAIFQDATLEQLQDEELLKRRFPKLIEDFRKDIISFGFTF